MSEAEYMKNVRWTTFIYSAVSAGSILLAIAGVYYGLKGDITDNRTQAREQIEHVANRLNSKIDSIHSVDLLEFQDIRQQISNMPSQARRAASVGSTYGLYIQRVVNGKLTFIPYK